MLRLLPKIIALILALVLVALGGLSLALPRLVNSDEFRRSLNAAAEEAIGSPVEWSALDAGVVPLRLTMQAPVLSGSNGNPDDARFRADAVDLRLDTLAFLGGRIEVDSLVFRGVDIVVTRTAEGLIHPFAKSESTSTIAPQPAPIPQPPGEGEDARADSRAASEVTPDPGPPAEEVALAIRHFEIRDSRILVHDRSLPRPIDWELAGARLEATGSALDSPFEIDFEARVLANGDEIGGLESDGRVRLAGAYDLDVRLDALRLDAFQPYVSEATVAGLASGTMHLEGAPGLVGTVETDLEIEKMTVRTLGLDLAGRLDLVASQTGESPIVFRAGLDLGPRGQAEVDGTMDPAGGVDAAIALRSLDLEPFSALAGDAIRVGGLATGRVELATGDDQSLARLATDLVIDDARYADASIKVGGRLDLGLDLSGLEASDPVGFDVALELDGAGGRIEAKGISTLSGVFDARIVLGNVDLAPIAPWLPEETEVGGRLSGTADLKVDEAGLVERLEATAKLASGRYVSPSIEVGGDFDLEIGREGEGPFDLRAALALSDGSRIGWSGTSSPDGVLDLTARVTSFDLALAQPFLPQPGIELAGKATGTGRLVGAFADPEFVAVDLGIEAGSFVSSEYEVEGPFLAVIEIKEPASRPRGRIDLDLTAARLRYLDQFTKRAGMRAEMTTRFVPEDSGELVFESKLKLRDVDEILIQGAVGETTSVTLSSTHIDLEGWQEVLPFLAPYSPDGLVRLDGIAIEWIDGTPSRFEGRAVLRGVGVSVPDVGRVRLRGSIEGEGSSLRANHLEARVAGAVLGIRGTIEDPLGEGAFDVDFETVGEVEANEVLSAISNVRDRVFGPLVLRGDLSGVLSGGGDLVETLEGDLRLTIGEGTGGQLRGVSLLRAMLDQIPLLGQVGQASPRADPLGGENETQGADSLDHFELISGEFGIGGGQIDARKLSLAYPGYEARLAGPIGLRDLSLDMRGELLLKDDLVTILGGAAGASLPDRPPIRIRLARVTQTLHDPRVSMSPEMLVLVPKLLLQGTGLDTITFGLRKGLRKGIGEGLRAVENLLGERN